MKNETEVWSLFAFYLRASIASILLAVLCLPWIREHPRLFTVDVMSIAASGVLLVCVVAKIALDSYKRKKESEAA